MGPEILKEREGYGEERYEKIDFQTKVFDVFNKLGKEEPSWTPIDAGQRGIDEIHKEIVDKAVALLEGEREPISCSLFN